VAVKKLQGIDLLFHEIANDGNLEKVKSVLEKHHQEVSAATIQYHYELSLLFRDEAQAGILIDYLQADYMNHALMLAASSDCFDIAIELLLAKNVIPTSENMAALVALSTSEDPPRRIETLVVYAALSHNLEANGIPIGDRRKYFDSKACLTGVSKMPDLKKDALDNLLASDAKTSSARKRTARF
jgi:hypothetical protein